MELPKIFLDTLGVDFSEQSIANAVRKCDTEFRNRFQCKLVSEDELLALWDVMGGLLEGRNYEYQVVRAAYEAWIKYREKIKMPENMRIIIC